MGKIDRWGHTLKGVVVMLLFWVYMPCAFSQVDEVGLVYKFQVQGVNDPVVAKPLQYALMEEPETISCIYIAECGCFRLNSTHDYDQDGFFQLVHDLGYAMTGQVMVSDGRVWEAGTEAPMIK